MHDIDRKVMRKDLEFTCIFAVLANNALSAGRRTIHDSANSGKIDETLKMAIVRTRW